jgi:hypothetical protein
VRRGDAAAAVAQKAMGRKKAAFRGMIRVRAPITAGPASMPR